MVTQSRAEPTPLLLTRPAAQGADFAERLTGRFGDAVAIINTPLLAPQFFAPELPAGLFEALILTSQTAVDAYVRLGRADALPKDAFCVGERTACAARNAGLRTLAISPDAASLIIQIISLQPKGTLLHLRGRETRGNIETLLQTAGIDTVDTIIYAQNSLPLSAKATQALQSENPILVPLFSPRSAALFVRELARFERVSPLLIAAISSETILELNRVDAQIKLANRPDASAMMDVLDMFLADLKRA